LPLVLVLVLVLMLVDTLRVAHIMRSREKEDDIP
jgi:hypothetical protein